MMKLAYHLSKLATPLTFWWRDDDLTHPTPQGDKLLALATRTTIPLHVAIIPEPADQSLTHWLPPDVTILQHGIRHENNALQGQKKCELTSDVSISDLRQGNDKLKGLFGDRYTPILVPPWNRVHPFVVHNVRDVYKAVSTFYLDEQNYALPTIQTHLDLIDWDQTRDVKPMDQLEDELISCLHFQEPIGLLTHHLAHSTKCWEVLDHLFDLLLNTPQVSFTCLRKLDHRHPLVLSI